MSESTNKSQVVERTCAILKEISRHGSAGARLIHVTKNTGLSRPTAHRILATLVSERFVRRTENRRYQLAPLIHEMGLSAPSPVNNLEALRDIVQAFADDVGDTVYLALRRGDHAQYLLRCEGAYPIRTHMVSSNHSLHLVSGHSGRALLAAMDEEEAEDVIRRAERMPDLFGAATPESLRLEVELVREKGYGWARDVTFVGVAGLTVQVPNPNGTAYLALTISSIPQRLDKERSQILLPQLRDTAKAISKSIQDS